jgi:cytochrome c oxidase subunit IV
MTGAGGGSMEQVATSPAGHTHPKYMLIFLYLALLTGVELGVAFLPWPKMALIITLLVLAVWKAVMVALFYMHLKFEPQRVRLMVIAPLPLAVILVLAVITEFVW